MGIVYKGKYPKLDEAIKDFPEKLEKCREKAIGYISKEALMVAFADRVVKNTGNETLLTWNDAEDIVCNFPTADVRPVTHGWWLTDKETGEMLCSECGRTSCDLLDEMHEYEGKKVITLYYPHYCGFCGAKMDKEESNG